MIASLARRPRGLLLAAFVTIVAVIAIVDAAAPRRLGVAGDRLTVDDAPAFLTFVSYFDALDANDDVLREDFAYFRDHRIDGVRIFANWWDCADLNTCKTPSPRTLMDVRGALRPATRERLLHVLDLAADHRLLVDLSFAREPVRAGDHALDADHYRAGLIAAVRLLDGRAPHVIFDLQNEIEIHGLGRGTTSLDALADEVAQLRKAMRDVDSARLVIASTGSVELIRRFAAQPTPMALDAIAYHDPRLRDWWSRTKDEVVALKALSGRPIYFQEPIAYQLAEARPGRDDTDVAHFQSARRAARDAGAAAWLFHTRKGFRLDDHSFVSQQEPGEKAFFAALATEAR